MSVLLILFDLESTLLIQAFLIALSSNKFELGIFPKALFDTIYSENR